MTTGGATGEISGLYAGASEQAAGVQEHFRSLLFTWEGIGDNNKPADIFEREKGRQENLQ